MASSKDRQRKLARDKLDRQLARRAGRTRRRRQIQAGVGATVALALIVLGGVWLLNGSDTKATEQQTEAICAWTPQNATTNTSLKDVGTPPTTGIPTAGTRPMTITTNQGGPITVALDLDNSPCGAASLTYLASRTFYDNTTCHEITTEGALRCGDPSGTGQGGPTYSFYNENEPATPDPQPSASAGAKAAAAKQPPLYPKGTVAFIGSPPDTNGSQFLVFLRDFSPADPQYSIVGKVTSGFDVLAKIAKIPTVDNGADEKVKPKEKIIVQSLTVGEVSTPAPAEPSTIASVAPSTSGRS